MKCPQCGFETPDTQDWCDFCKEPFRKKKPSEPAKEAPPAEPKKESPAPGPKKEAPPPGPAPQSPPPVAGEKPVQVSAELLMKVAGQKHVSGSPEAPRSGEPAIPPEFAHLDAGERMPVIPPAFKYAAYALLAAVILFMAVATVVMLGKARDTGRSGRAPVHRSR